MGKIGDLDATPQAVVRAIGRRQRMAFLENRKETCGGATIDEIALDIGCNAWQVERTLRKHVLRLWGDKIYKVKRPGFGRAGRPLGAWCIRGGDAWEDDEWADGDYRPEHRAKMAREFAEYEARSVKPLTDVHETKRSAPIIPIGIDAARQRIAAQRASYGRAEFMSHTVRSAAVFGELDDS